MSSTCLFKLNVRVLILPGLIAVAALAMSNRGARAQETPAAKQKSQPRDERLDAIEKTLQALIKDVQALKQPSAGSATSGSQQSQPPAKAVPNCHAAGRVLAADSGTDRDGSGLLGEFKGGGIQRGRSSFPSN